MDELTLAREWYRYNVRVREGYLDKILTLPGKERMRDRGASFPSIQDVFVHVLDAYRWWFHHVAEDDVLSFQPLRLSKSSPLAIRRAVAETNQLVLGYLKGLTEADLGKWIIATYMEDGKKGRIRIRVRDMLWHMVEEELQHRGELNALLWQLEVDPPIQGWGDPPIRKRRPRKGRK